MADASSPSAEPVGMIDSGRVMLDVAAGPAPNSTAVTANPRSARGTIACPVPVLDLDPVDVAPELDGVEILRTEDVQVGRCGPTWTS
jgi:hypothetical protein